jgi:hypothetical protein
MHSWSRASPTFAFIHDDDCLPGASISNTKLPWSIIHPSIHGGLPVLVARTPAAMLQLSLLIPIRARPTPTVFAAVAFPWGSKRVEDAAAVQVSVQNGDGTEESCIDQITDTKQAASSLSLGSPSSEKKHHLESLGRGGFYS